MCHRSRQCPISSPTPCQQLAPLPGTPHVSHPPGPACSLFTPHVTEQRPPSRSVRGGRILPLTGEERREGEGGDTQLRRWGINRELPKLIKADGLRHRHGHSRHHRQHEGEADDQDGQDAGQRDGECPGGVPGGVPRGGRNYLGMTDCIVCLCLVREEGG